MSKKKGRKQERLRGKGDNIGCKKFRIALLSEGDATKSAIPLLDVAQRKCFSSLADGQSSDADYDS